MESVFVLLVLGLAASWYLATSAWARLLLLEGIGHMPMLEAPRKSAYGFLKFCKDRGILHCT